MAALTTLLLMSASASALTFGMMWDSFGGAESTESWDMIQRSGATEFRMAVGPNAPGNGTGWKPYYDKVFRLAAERNITILAGLGDKPTYPSGSELGPWYGWVQEVVKRYGYGGNFWKENPGLPPKPVEAWEVSNEPNLVSNNPMIVSGTKENEPTEAERKIVKAACSEIGQTYYSNSNNCVQPERYGSLLVNTSAKIQAASKEQSGTGTQVLFGGLAFPYGDPYKNFLTKAYKVSGLYSSYTGLSIHPYGFDFAHTNGDKTISEVTGEVSGVRAALNGLTWGPSRTLWITELGWPVNDFGNALFPQVKNVAEQARLLTESFNWIKSQAGALGIRSVYWYNDRDNGVSSWDYTSGLRTLSGRFRPAWNAYLAQTGALPDVYAIDMNGTGSKKTEVHVLSGSSKYAGWGQQLPTPLAETNPSQWRWEMGDTLIGGQLDGIADLVGVEMNGTSTHQTEVHVLNGASIFQSWGTQFPTPLGETNPNQWQWLMGDSDTNHDGIPDLVGINMNGTGSKQTEVHVLSGASNFRTWLTQVPTPLAETSPSQWQWLMGDANGDGTSDLVGVEMNGTSTHQTEVHILNGATNFQTWLTQVPTILGETNASQWQWTMADQNHDGIADLVGMALNARSSKKTEVHVLSGAANYQAWLTQENTALGETTTGQWRFLGEPPVGSNAAIAPPPPASETPAVVAVITPKEELFVKSGSLTGEWVHETDGVKAVSVASDPVNGPLIGVLTNTGHVLVKQGNLFGAWVDETAGAKAVSVASDPVNGPLIGVLTTTGHALVKKGNLTGEWVDETGGASAVRVATDPANGPLVGVLTTTGHALVKKGNLYGEWVDELSGSKDLSVATDSSNGPLIAVLTTAGHVMTKTTNLYGAWVDQGPNLTAVSAATDPTTGPVIGVLNSSNHALVKKNSLSAEWVDENANAKSVVVSTSELSGPFVGALTNDGHSYVKRGSLYAEWIDQFGAVPALSIAG